MTRQYRKPQSKGMRNLRSAANRTLHTTSNIAVKGIEKTAKWMATDHTGATRNSSLIDLQMRSNFSIAEINLNLRRMQRYNEQVSKYLNDGVEASSYEVVSGWLVDHIRYVWDVLWGFFEPIVSSILFVVFNSIVTFLFYCIFFYVLYLLLIA
jgi:hypothetical protein